MCYYVFINKFVSWRAFGGYMKNIFILYTLGVAAFFPLVSQAIASKDALFHAGAVGVATTGALGLTYAVGSAYDVYSRGSTLLDTIDATLEGAVVEQDSVQATEKKGLFARLKGSVQKITANVARRAKMLDRFEAF